MKNVLIAIATVALMTTGSAVYAGCGKKVATNGEVASYDADSKSITIMVSSASDPGQVKGKTATLTLTPDSKIMGGATAGDLEGKMVTVVSEHGKIDFVIPLAARTIN